jgi:Prealbumin-like fold domain
MITLREYPGKSAARSQCTSGSSGVQFTLTSSGGAGPAPTFTTDGNSVASSQVPPGTYTLEELGANWCVADSAAFDATGALNVAGDAADVAIYNCA